MIKNLKNPFRRSQQPLSCYSEEYAQRFSALDGLYMTACALCTGIAGGLRAAGPKADIALIVADKEAVVGGAFTQNVMSAAPVTYCKEILAKRETVRAVRTALTSASRPASNKPRSPADYPKETVFLGVTRPLYAHRLA